MSDEKLPAPEPLAHERLGQLEWFPIASAPEKFERPLLRPLTLRTYARTELPSTIEPEKWSRGVEVHERELPAQLYNDLHELVPQALLRDLHRPVKQFFVEPELREGTAVVGAIHGELERVRAARRLEPRIEVAPTASAFAEEQHRRRALMAERWMPMLDDDAPRTNVEVFHPTEVVEEFYRPDFSKYRKGAQPGIAPPPAPPRPAPIAVAADDTDVAADDTDDTDATDDGADD